MPLEEITLWLTFTVRYKELLLLAFLEVHVGHGRYKTRVRAVGAQVCVGTMGERQGSDDRLYILEHFS